MLASFRRLFRGASCDGGAHGDGATETVPPESFLYTIPRGAVAGQEMRVQGPGGVEIDIVVPPGAKPGQKLKVRIDRDAAAARGVAPHLKDLFLHAERSAQSARGVRSGCKSRLDDEVGLRVATWASEQTTDEGISQTQALLIAAAEVGDSQQLFGALAELRPFFDVPASLDEAVRRYCDAEEALITWRCLADAARGGDVPAIETWVEQARRLGLDLPERLVQAATAPQAQAGAQAGAQAAPGAPTTAGASPSGYIAGGAPAPTVWDRRKPPARYSTQRQKARFLLGLEMEPGKRFTQQELKSAYRRAALECHPDRGHNHARQAEAKELFQKVKEAFDFLSQADNHWDS